MKTIDAWLEHIEHLHSKPIDMGLERMKDMLKRLNIQFDVPVFTVGGTNGKGSVCSYLENILTAAGYKVAVHTSPHLIRFNERARVGGRFVEDEEICRHFEKVEKARGEGTLSYFEYTLLAILSWFQEVKPDALVLEIGLGGRLDAVNTIEPTVSIITSVGIDHTAFLGNTREEIGWDKAHIYRPGKPAVCGDLNPPQTLIDYAQEIGAKLEIAGKDFKAEQTSPDSWTLQFRDWSTSQIRQLEELPLPAMRGIYQINNAAASLVALQAVPTLRVSRKHICQGLQTAQLTGRFQKVQDNPEIILDVGHNPHAAEQLAKTLAANPIKGKTIAVFGMLSDKDREQVCRIMAPYLNECLTADLDGPRGGKGEDLAKFLLSEGIDPAKIKNFSTVEDALRNALGKSCSTDRILVFGSFVTVSKAVDMLKVPVL